MATNYPPTKPKRFPAPNGREPIGPQEILRKVRQIETLVSLASTLVGEVIRETDIPAHGIGHMLSGAGIDLEDVVQGLRVAAEKLNSGPSVCGGCGWLPEDCCCSPGQGGCAMCQ